MCGDRTFGRTGKKNGDIYPEAVYRTMWKTKLSVTAWKHLKSTEIIDDVIMVAGAGQEDYVTEEISK